MPKIHDAISEKVSMFLPQKFDWVCECHKHDYPPFTGEIHGMSQALMSRNLKQRIFWWLVVLICIIGGTSMVVMVVIEYMQGPTATSTTIKLVNSLELPAITVCPKTPDAFDWDLLFENIQEEIPDISDELARDLIKFWLAGSGLENMNDVASYNMSYLNFLDSLYKTWSNRQDAKKFFDNIQEKFGYKCEDLFESCVLGGKNIDCCNDMFERQVVPRRGICYQTRRGVNQTETDDIGRLVFHIKATRSVTMLKNNFTQVQTLIYINDNFNYITDYPRFYLYPNQWNRMHFTARYIDLLPSKDCSEKIFGKDTQCFLKNWLFINMILPYNCTLPYMKPPFLRPIKGVPDETPVCEPLVIAKDYNDKILTMNSGYYGFRSSDCIPGCNRWDFSTIIQQGEALEPFSGYTFNLEYEFLQEVLTTSIPGFMSQIGGQFGFFLGLSIITMIQVVIFLVSNGIVYLKNWMLKRKLESYEVEK